ncbi:hypothetical protein TNCT_180441 [Trichonephila clavata]|uniref:Uncharacterized protein n=1 Tax=Trichonephila clavata TaxID=2740835 RepID=A0A8X6J7Y1_TRICU|nr:hypothetical protein TNCT_180441 [Trichonephila clavata]
MELKRSVTYKQASVIGRNSFLNSTRASDVPPLRLNVGRVRARGKTIRTVSPNKCLATKPTNQHPIYKAISLKTDGYFRISLRQDMTFRKDNACAWLANT